MVGEEKSVEMEDPSDHQTNGHPPIYSRQPKSTSRPKKTPKSRGKVTSDLFAPLPSNQTPESTTSVQLISQQLSKYAISATQEVTDLNFTGIDLPVRATTQGDSNATQPTQGSATESESPTNVSGKDGNDTSAMPFIRGDDSDDEDIQEYPAEARAYHARYAELSAAHDQRRYQECLEGSRDLLTESRLPTWTRIQTLQMLSTISRPACAEQCPLAAAAILDELDMSEFQNRLLREDNDKMLADLEKLRSQRGLIGQSLEGELGDDIEPEESYFQLDRDLQDKLDRELEEEIEPFGRTIHRETGDRPTTPMQIDTTDDQGDDDTDMPDAGGPYTLLSPDATDDEL
ncbi:hypothetical protein LTR95_009109 [Oleoguttula sp. CCFEE 5521]